jgi:hypothetical protein
MYHDAYVVHKICTHLHHFIRKLIHYVPTLPYLYKTNMEVLDLQVVYENIDYLLHLFQSVIVFQFKIGLIC